jgi:hypothetical protein
MIDAPPEPWEPKTAAEAAAEMASSAHAVQIVILLGLVTAGVINAVPMRAWLQSLVDDLRPAERQQSYGRFLSQTITALDDCLAGKFHRPKFQPLKLH